MVIAKVGGRGVEATKTSGHVLRCHLTSRLRKPRLIIETLW